MSRGVDPVFLKLDSSPVVVCDFPLLRSSGRVETPHEKTDGSAKTRLGSLVRRTVRTVRQFHFEKFNRA